MVCAELQGRDVNPLLGPDQAGPCGRVDAQNPIDNLVPEIDSCIAAARRDPVLRADAPAPQASSFDKQIGLNSDFESIVVERDAAGCLARAIAADHLVGLHGRGVQADGPGC